MTYTTSTYYSPDLGRDCSTIHLTLRGRPYAGAQLETHDVSVDEDGLVRWLDSIAGHHLPVRTPSMIRRARRAARLSA